LEDHSRPQPPPVPQHSQWFWDFGPWTDPPIFAKTRKKLDRMLWVPDLLSSEENRESSFLN
jgi:hypothetical protein